MPYKPNLWILSALLCAGAWPTADAQTVYQCGRGRSTLYSEKPCSPGRVVNTDDAQVPARPSRKDVDTRRLEQNRAVARAMRRKPGEGADDFETRRRRASLLRTDREECARLDASIPVHQASTTNPDKAEALKAEIAVGNSTRRYTQLRC